MIKKILIGFVIVGGLLGSVHSGIVIYIKNPDGTVTRQEGLTSDEAAQKLTEIRQQIKVLGEQNIIELQRISQRQIQINDLKAQELALVAAE